MSSVFWDSVKEVLRLILLAVVSYLLTEGVLSGLVFAVVGNKLSPTEVLFITGLITSVLKGLDKNIYLKQKAAGDAKSTTFTGLTGF
jgi:hypothetical protein